MSNEVILQGEEMYEKIKMLKQVQVDNNSWLLFYIDEANGEKWAKEFPESEYHGGGLPQLRMLEYFPWEQTHI